MFILGTICARLGSKGIPHKNTKLLGGKPLAVYTIECAQKTRAFDELVVSTDDPEVVAIAREREIPVLPRPAVLATDTASKWDVFRHIAGKFEPGIMVDLDIGCPFRSPEDITDCIQLLKANDADVVMTAYPAERNPYFNMVGKDGKIVCRDPFYAPFIRRQDAPEVFSLSPSVIAFRVEALQKYCHWSQSRMMIHVIPRARALDIDTPDDFEYAEWLMSRHD
jgi:N-acylneuraminate cytidylyltransferase/CMP-N,N'-diacetyllegionaminic acid synthase